MDALQRCGWRLGLLGLGEATLACGHAFFTPDEQHNRLLELLRPSLPTRVPACCPAGPVYNCQRPVAARAGQDRSEVLGTQPNSPAAAAGQRRSAPPAAGSRIMPFPAVPINWDAPASFYTGSDELAELAGGLASVCDAFEKSSSLHASVLPSLSQHHKCCPQSPALCRCAHQAQRPAAASAQPSAGHPIGSAALTVPLFSRGQRPLLRQSHNRGMSSDCVGCIPLTWPPAHTLKICDTPPCCSWSRRSMSTACRPWSTCCACSIAAQTPRLLT